MGTEYWQPLPHGIPFGMFPGTKKVRKSLIKSFNLFHFIHINQIRCFQLNSIKYYILILFVHCGIDPHRYYVKVSLPNLTRMMYNSCSVAASRLKYWHARIWNTLPVGRGWFKPHIIISTKHTKKKCIKFGISIGISKTNFGGTPQGPTTLRKLYLLPAVVLIIAYSNHENRRVGIYIYIIILYRKHDAVVTGGTVSSSLDSGQHTFRRPSALARSAGPGRRGRGKRRWVFESYRSGLGRPSSSSSSWPWSSAAAAGEYAGRILINASAAAAEFRRVVCKPRTVLTQRRPMNTKCVHITCGVDIAGGGHCAARETIILLLLLLINSIRYHSRI